MRTCIVCHMAPPVHIAIPLTPIAPPMCMPLLHCDHGYRKSQLASIESSLEKLLPKIAKPQARGAELIAHWQAAFEKLRTNGFFKPGLRWQRFPKARPPKTMTRQRTTTVKPKKASQVPNVLHAGWTSAQRKRAEVTQTFLHQIVCMTLWIVDSKLN